MTRSRWLQHSRCQKPVLTTEAQRTRRRTGQLNRKGSQTRGAKDEKKKDFETADIADLHSASQPQSKTDFCHRGRREHGGCHSDPATGGEESFFSTQRRKERKERKLRNSRCTPILTTESTGNTENNQRISTKHTKNHQEYRGDPVGRPKPETRGHK